MKDYFKLLGFFIFMYAFSAPVNANITNNYKAPLYWSVYEYCYTKDGAIPENIWKKNIDWVNDNLKQYGYNMICIDGWGDDYSYNEHGYRTKHSTAWKNDYAAWADYLKDRGMTLGMYNNPLWINKAAAEKGLKIKGTDIPLSTLIDPNEKSTWFTWVQVDRPGAEEYVKGYIQYYADMGISYLRVDFLSWYEDGIDKNPKYSAYNPKRTKVQYRKALQWMKEACDSNAITLSLVMPHLYNHAENEMISASGSLIRINEDVATGGWNRFNNLERGKKHNIWSTYYNTFDGFIHWSDVAGFGAKKFILDGDFTRLNTFSNDEERKTAISLQLIAGGPIAVSDQYNTIGKNIWLYQNEEMLQLNADGFVGQPLSRDVTNSKSQIWKGQMSNGDWIVAFFNRENTTQQRSINFSQELNLTEGNVRDLWKHEDLGRKSSLSDNIAAHGCRVYRISARPQAGIPVFSIKEGNYKDKQYISITSDTEEAKIYYTIDGSKPTTSSKLYSKPIEVSSSTTLKAMSVKDGLSNSSITAQTYVIGKIPGQIEMYVAGSFSNWKPANYPMTYIGDNKWETESVKLSSTTYTMKFLNTQNWSGDDWGGVSGISGIAKKTTGETKNLSFKITEKAYYKFIFNDYTLEYEIVKTGENPLFLTGSAMPCGWVNNTPERMTYAENGYTWEGNLKKGEFKILTELNDWKKCYNAKAPNTILSLDGSKESDLVYNEAGKNDYKFYVAKAGSYIITVDLTVKTIKIKEIKDKNKMDIICIGNSITAGYGLSNLQNAYPQTLGRLLGDKYQVINYGVSGRTLLKNGDLPYWKEQNFTLATNSNPDIVIIKLGSNDSKPINWSKNYSSFKADLIDMVKIFTSLSSNPKIYLGTPLYVKPKLIEGTAQNIIRGSIIKDQIIPVIKEVAKEYNIQIIDFYEMSNGWGSDMFSDKVHPNAAGAGKMAEYAKKIISQEPVITGPKSVHFDAAILNVTNTENIIVTGRNLVGDLNVSVSGEGFNVNTNKILVSSIDSIYGCKLSVNLRPTSIKEYKGAIVITGEGVDSLTINLSGNGRELYLTGDATPFGWTAKSLPMKMISANDKLEWTGYLKNKQFKFLTNWGKWNQCYNATVINQIVETESNTEYDIRFVPSEEKDYKFVLSSSGYATVTVDMKTKKISVKKVPLTGLWATGSALSNQVVPLAEDENGIFNLATKLQAGNLIFMNRNDMSDKTLYLYPVTDGIKIDGKTTVQISSNPRLKGWTITNTNGYRIKINLNGNYVNSSIVYPKKALYLIGGATDARWNLNNAIPFIQHTDNPFLYSLECNLKINNIGEGNQFKILGQKSWNGFSFHSQVKNEEMSERMKYIERVAPASPDNKWIVPVTKQGKYKLTIDLLNEKITAESLLLISNNLRMADKRNLNIEFNSQPNSVHIRYLDNDISYESEISLISIINGSVIRLLKTNQQEITILNVPQGNYIVKIVNGNDMISRKVYVK